MTEKNLSFHSFGMLGLVGLGHVTHVVHLISSLKKKQGRLYLILEMGCGRVTGALGELLRKATMGFLILLSLFVLESRMWCGWSYRS